MGPAPAGHEDETFWEALEAVVFPPEKLEAAGAELERLLTLVDVEEGARVLDIPCGVGRHAVEFADRGFDVTGVDATEPYLETAADRAAAAGAAVEFVHADMRAFRRPAAFDLVVNLYTSFGYFEDRAADERVARNLYESLRPGGTLVMSLTSKELLAREFRERTWTESDGVYLLEEREVRDDWSRMDDRWIVFADGERREYDVSHRLYSAYELAELLRSVGFEDVTAYGDLEGSDFDADAERLVVVAER